MAAGARTHLLHLSKESNKPFVDQTVRYEYDAKNDDAPDAIASGLSWVGLIRGNCEMNFLEAFGFAARPTYVTELPEIYPLGVKLEYFIRADLFNIYSKILTDCVYPHAGHYRKIRVSLLGQLP